MSKNLFLSISDNLPSKGDDPVAKKLKENKLRQIFLSLKVSTLEEALVVVAEKAKEGEKKSLDVIDGLSDNGLYSHIDKCIKILIKKKKENSPINLIKKTILNGYNEFKGSEVKNENKNK